MAAVIKTEQPLMINPLVVSQYVGAVLAFLGIARCMPLTHGVRGCAAFTKLFFMRHFREPIALQTTAIDQAATILGSGRNIFEALGTIIEQHNPDMIGLVATPLAEFQGVDLPAAVEEFRENSESFRKTAIIPVTLDDTAGGLEQGYASAVEAMIVNLVPETAPHSRTTQRVNLLVSPMLTPGDIEVLKDWVQAFGLTPIVLPDLGDSLDGHLVDEGFLPLTYGGTTCSNIASLGDAIASLVIGPSLFRAGELLQSRTGVRSFYFDALMGLDACDRFTATLQKIADTPVPSHLQRQRAQLLDAMVDCQFYTAGTTAGLASDPDLLGAWLPFLEGVGVHCTTVVASIKTDSLNSLPTEQVLLGDLGVFEQALCTAPTRVILSNSHAVSISDKLHIPLLRIGYPQYDQVGVHTKRFIGYRGSREALFEVTNLLLQSYKGTTPYHSIYRAPNDEQLNHLAAAPLGVEERVPTCSE